MKKTFFGTLFLLLFIYVGSLTYIGIHVFDDTVKKSDAVVVLGARSEFKNNINPCLVERVKKGVSLTKQGYAKTIIMSGGVDRFGEDSEAQIMKSKAVEFGASPEGILLEDKSKNTYENLLFTQKILTNKKIHSIIIVSDPYHLPRASLIAKTLGLSYTVSPALMSPCWDKYKFFGIDYLRDGFALLAYIATGKIRFGK
jgi:uncharacterized SAM-binding protein YcdF (DUF218 family)